MKRAVQLGLSLGVTVLLSWWAFRDADWSEQWSSLRSANYLWLVPYLGVLLAIHVARTLRWGCLLSSHERVPFRKLNEAAAIGFMMLIVLPFRLGEFARPFLLAQRSSIRRSAAMATVVLERIVDGVAVALLLWALLFFVPEGAPNLPLVRFAANVMFGIFAGGAVFLLFAARYQQLAVGLVRLTLGWASPRVAEKVAGVVETFVGALRQLPSRGQLAAFLALTAVYWGLNGVGLMLLARAFELPSGAAPSAALGLSLYQAYVVLGVLVVGVMIPSAPGMVGTFQAAVKVGLGLFFPAVVVNSVGLAYANVLWLCQTLQQVGLGLLVMSFAHLSFRELAGKLQREGDSGTAGAGELADPEAGALALPAPGQSKASR